MKRTLFAFTIALHFICAADIKLGVDVTTNYVYTLPQVKENIKGKGVGGNSSAAYSVMRSEDIAFLTEAYTEFEFTVNRGLNGLPLKSDTEHPELPKIGSDTYLILALDDNWPPFSFLKDLQVENSSKDGFITVASYIMKRDGIIKSSKKPGQYEWLNELFDGELRNNNFITTYLEDTQDNMKIKKGTRPKLNRICKYYLGMFVLHNSHYAKMLTTKGIFSGNVTFGGTNTVVSNIMQPMVVESVEYDGASQKWVGYNENYQDKETSTPVSVDRKVGSKAFYESGYSSVRHKRAFEYTEGKEKKTKTTDVDLKTEQWIEKQTLSGTNTIEFGDAELLHYGDCNHLKSCELYGLFRVCVVTNEVKANNGQTNTIKNVKNDNYYIAKIPTNTVNGICCATICSNMTGKMECQIAAPFKEVVKRVLPIVGYEKSDVAETCPQFSPESPSIQTNHAAGTTSHQYNVHTIIELKDVAAIFEMRYRTKMPQLESDL